MGFTASVRVPAGEQVGSTGATLVKAAFERLGWGVAVNPEHDLGTDLFVMARDERRFDLGQVVGVQVKAGRRYFKHRSRSGGAVVGWWFRDDDRAHIDAWLSHALPHLIVLHDPVSEQSYWAHVTQDAVLSAGKGAKIFVPKKNTIDTAHRDALLQVAAMARADTVGLAATALGADREPAARLAAVRVYDDAEAPAELRVAVVDGTPPI